MGSGMGAIPTSSVSMPPKAYEMPLKKYHGWIVQKNLPGSAVCQSLESDFLKTLCKGQNMTEEDCLEKVCLFLVNYTATIEVICEIYIIPR